jgi:hypothetical protein
MRTVRQLERFMAALGKILIPAKPREKADIFLFFYLIFI